MTRKTQRRYEIPGVKEGEPVSFIISREAYLELKRRLDENRLRRFRSWRREAYRRLD